jgi:hypothetical protein
MVFLLFFFNRSCDGEALDRSSSSFPILKGNKMSSQEPKALYPALYPHLLLAFVGKDRERVRFIEHAVGSCAGFFSLSYEGPVRRALSVVGEPHVKVPIDRNDPDTAVKLQKLRDLFREIFPGMLLAEIKRFTMYQDVVAWDVEPDLEEFRNGGGIVIHLVEVEAGKPPFTRDESGDIWVQDFRDEQQDMRVLSMLEELKEGGLGAIAASIEESTVPA